MTIGANQSKDDFKGGKGMNNAGLSGGIYGLAFLGALIYYFTHSVTFLAYVFGFFKAIFWPAFLIYHLFEFLMI
jgi:hypothetical protein